MSQWGNGWPGGRMPPRRPDRRRPAYGSGCRHVPAICGWSVALIAAGAVVLLLCVPPWVWIAAAGAALLAAGLMALLRR